MELFVVGTSHWVASARLRERLHVHPEEVYEALTPRGNERELLAEVVPVATCGRLELYGVADDVDRAARAIERTMADRAGLTLSELKENTYLYRGPDAVRHLLRVSAGLDSAVHGEAQILGQIRAAIRHAAAAAGSGPILHRLFQSALTTGKRVRSETDIGRGAASLASASLTMLEREMGGFGERSALVLGAGGTGTLMARLLTSSGVRRLAIANRTESRARRLAGELNAEAYGLDSVDELLPHMDLVVGAITTIEPLITTEEAGRANGGRVRYYLDLAHPRNFEPALAALPGVRLFDLDAVFERVDQVRHHRASQVPQAESIVEQETGAFLGWLRARDNARLVRAVRAHVMERAMAEAERYARQLPPGNHEHARRLARSIARALLHQPTLAIRGADPTSEDGRELLAGAARLFGVREASAGPGDPTEPA